MVCHSLLNNYGTSNKIFKLIWKCTSVSLLYSGRGALSYECRNEITNHSSWNDDPCNLSTVSDLHKEWSQRFETDGIAEPESSIRFIVEHVLGIKKAYKYELNQNEKVTKEQENQIRTLCECRLARMPIQYIIKEWDFRDLHLAMWPPVFIPRPETEQLIDLVVETVPVDSVLLEIGCGSGAIALSLLKSLPKAQVVAVDQSKLACQLTLHNAKLNGLTSKLQVVHSKLKEDGSVTEPLPVHHVDVLVSNPPYVPSTQILSLQPEIKLYEDLRALEAGPDGLRVVKSLFHLAQTILKRGGHMFLEVDATHPKLIKKWVEDHPEIKISFIKTFKDFCDRDRFVMLKKS